MHSVIKTLAKSQVIAVMTVNLAVICKTELSASVMNSNSGCISVQLTTQSALHYVVQSYLDL